MTSFRVRAIDATPSTNSEVKRAIDAGEAEGLVVRARVQTGGYGRQGRAWTSPEGGLYCSLLLRPVVDPSELPTLSLVVGMAVRRALVTFLEPAIADAVQIKWPNDVVLVQRERAPREVPAHEAQPYAAPTCEAPACEMRPREAQPCEVPAHEAQPCTTPACETQPHEAQPHETQPHEAQPHETLTCKASSNSLAQKCRSARFSEPIKNSDQGFCELEANSKVKNRAERHFCASEDIVDGSPRARALTPAKLCGISLEAHGGGVCVGVGVNVLPPVERPDVGGKNRPAYLADFASADITVEHALEAFLADFAPLYDCWQCGGFGPLATEFNDHASLNGQFVRVVDRVESPLAAGTVVRVDAHGRLVLRASDGTETPVASGEIHLV